MSRLYRPTVPVEIECRVALRHLGEIDISRLDNPNNEAKVTLFAAINAIETQHHHELPRVRCCLIATPDSCVSGLDRPARGGDS